MLDRIEDLYKVNPEHTKDLIFRFSKTQDQQILTKLKPFPSLQLDFLEKNVLTVNAGHHLSLELKILHLQLLAKQKREQ